MAFNSFATYSTDFGRLRRSAQARPDVVREMRNLLVCVIATQRRLLQSF